MGTMKGGIVPEDKRAAIYNLYRIPLNFIVLFSLEANLTPTISFALTASMLAVATGLQLVLTKRRLENQGIQDSEDYSVVEATPLVKEAELSTAV